MLRNRTPNKLLVKVKSLNACPFAFSLDHTGATCRAFSGWVLVGRVLAVDASVQASDWEHRIPRSGEAGAESPYCICFGCDIPLPTHMAPDRGSLDRTLMQCLCQEGCIIQLLARFLKGPLGAKISTLPQFRAIASGSRGWCLVVFLGALDPDKVWVLRLGALVCPFFGWEASPKQTAAKRKGYQLILTSQIWRT